MTREHKCKEHDQEDFCRVIIFLTQNGEFRFAELAIAEYGAEINFCPYCGKPAKELENR